MEEARAVLARLRRIEALERERAGPRALLAEVERLLVEAEAWLRLEGGDETAAATLARARSSVEAGRKEMIPM